MDPNGWRMKSVHEVCQERRFISHHLEIINTEFNIRSTSHCEEVKDLDGEEFSKGLCERKTRNTRHWWNLPGFG